jgi:predicted MFS family arabinose efflux permease
VINRRHIIALGISQLVCWGISFYLIGVFGDLITAELGWSRTIVHGGFSVALLVMAVISPIVGSAIDRNGGGPVMSFGSIMCALGCILLASTHSLPAYYIAWVCLGIAMRCFLYDASFAALARIAGPEARRPISHITLFGGLASTCFWPIGHALAEALGWRGALVIYALLALLTLPLHLTLPKGKHADTAPAGDDRSVASLPGGNTHNLFRAFLYALIIALGNGLNAGMSAHMISVMTELGLGASLAVTVAALRGIGQSTARLADILFGRRLHPVDLNLIAAIALPLSFVVGLASGGYFIAAVVFSFTYGGATGLLTIARGTLPLVLFDYRTYGAFVGKLLVPSFILSALAPISFAFVIDEFGAGAALGLAIVVGLTILTASLALKVMKHRLP